MLLTLRAVIMEAKQIEQLAQRLNISARYLKRIVTVGGAGYSLAIRLARYTGERPERFLYKTPHKGGSGPQSGRELVAKLPANNRSKRVGE